jgi:hypothetical protein
MLKLIVVLIVCIRIIAAPEPSHASQILYLPGIAYQISAVTNEISTGTSMAGMLSAFHFNYAGSTDLQYVSWTANGPYATAQVKGLGTLIQLSATGNLWTLNVAPGVDLIDITTWALQGNTVFDTGLNVGTTGSGSGRDCALLSPVTGGNIAISYMDIVALQSSGNPAGDLYGTLHIDFLTPPRTTYYFQLDTDTVSGATASPVPVPSGLILICSGLLCLFGIRKRKTSSD